MSIAIVVLASGAFVVSALALSALAGGLALAAGTWLARFDAATRVRVWTVVAIAPLALGALAVALSLAPSLGWGVDHCDVHEAHHPHLCLAHAHLHGGWAVIALVAVVAVRFAAAGGRVAAQARRANRVQHALDGLCRPGDGVAVVGMAEPWALTLGWLRPRAFVSAGVPEGIRAAVVAHERAHVRHRDPAARALLEIALAFHLPGIAGALRRALHRAHEARADVEAAHELGDASTVAAALVAMARLGRTAAPAGAAGFEGDVEARVVELLDERPRRIVTWPALVAVGAAVVAAAIAAADEIHHLLESVLGVFGA